MKRVRQRWARFWARLTHPKQWNWLKVSVAVSIALVAGIAFSLAGMGVVHVSDTNPHFCASCHVMQKNVDSYLTGNNLDNLHARAGVECKECHDYPIPAEIRSGIKFIMGDYYVEDDGSLVKREFGDDMCLQCHISIEHLANSTDFLVRNPHLTHEKGLRCADCHVSHGKQINYCAECHDSGGQRMVGGEIFPRAENPWADPNKQPPDTSGLATPEK